MYTYVDFSSQTVVIEMILFEVGGENIVSFENRGKSQ
jgi:hypothetical protein